LATLGYPPSRRRAQYLPLLVCAVLIAGIAGLGWITWRAYLDGTADAVPTRRVLSPGMPKPAPPIPRPVPATSDAESNASAGGAADLPPAAPMTRAEVSSVGHRALSPAALDRPRATDPAIVKFRSSQEQPGPASDTSTPAAGRDNDLDLAIYYHRAGDFPNALQHYRALIERNELNAQAHNNLGLLYQERNLLQESARELQRAVVIEPRNPSTRNNYGATLLMLGRTDEAAAEFQTALFLDRRNVDALINLSLVERKTGQVETAKETLLRVLNVSPQNAAAHYNLAQLYDESNEPARAVEHYRLFLDHAGAEHANRGAAVRARIAALNRMPE
jgi:type IV pilus assembly protein PilF